jgi:Ca2+-binding RTX toxin-like protein
VSSRGTTVIPVPATRPERPAGERGLRWVGAVVILVGAVLICLAGAELGGRGDRIAGMGGGDTLHGAAGADAIYGGAGSDEIDAGPGEDGVLGGAGNDFVEAKDGVTDRVGCGPGKDAVSVDREDLISPDCERVYAG